MRAPVSWLAEHADLPAGLSARELAEALLRIGSEVESVDSAAAALSGPIVVGRVLSFTEEPQKNGKLIRWCQVEVGGGEQRGIVCGAHNFAAGDLVVVALPGAVLPGDFAIAARKTYGHVSDGMICSAAELGLEADTPASRASGILVLATDAAKPGDDPLELLGLREAVLDVAVTSDRGYCLSIRGLAREAAASLGVGFRDVDAALAPVDGLAYEVHIDDPSGCERFSVRAVEALDPGAATPDWLARRLRQCGMRSISLAVDVTNYVMLETGQPLHAFDRDKVTGAIRARRARAGERLTTLDGTVRSLDPEDMVVADDSGPIALAGVMGGAATEVDENTRQIVLEAACWDPDSVAHTVRRHHLPSEAARRFERGVDPEIAGVALARCVELLAAYGGARAVAGYTVVGERRPPAPIALEAGLAERTAGMPIASADVIAHLEAVGCGVADGEPLSVTPPSWRPDLLVAADLVEEIVRLAGYDRLPSVLPPARSGGGLTGRQAMFRAISRALAAAGYLEVLSFPFVSASIHEALGLAADDPRRRALRLANPLSEDEPELRTSLLPGLFATALRNLGRGNRNLALVETGLVFRARPGAAPAPLPGIDARPTDAELVALDATLPEQPRHVAVLLTGELMQKGWWGSARSADWADAVEAAQLVARTARADLQVRAASTAPWHPGRCAALTLGERVIGHAGELHPRVITTFGLPARTCAMELDLDAVHVPGPAVAPTISGYPPVLLDIALVVGRDVPAADLQRTLERAAGPLLEAIRLFDVYEGVGAGLRSLAFALRFRADDRTLTVEEASSARDAALAAAVAEHGARLRD